MSPDQLRPTPEKGVNSPLSRKAALLFTDASREYPASSSAQGAFIRRALRRQASPDNPIDLAMALVTDTQVVDDLVETANEMHRFKNVGPVDKEEAVRIVSADEIGFFSSRAFARAEAMDVLTDPDLEQLLHLYHEMHREDQPKFTEQEYAKSVMEILNIRAREQHAPPIVAATMNRRADAVMTFMPRSWDPSTNT